MSRKANGTGTIRKITTTKNGKKYTYWQARYTCGYDLGTGKQIQKTISGSSQKEVSQRLKKILSDLDDGIIPNNGSMTVIEWLETWKKEYLTDVKSRTRDSYITTIDYHLIPAFGAARLDRLKGEDIQKFYNRLYEGTKNRPGLSPKTIKNIHGVLHKALEQAVLLGYIRFNPTRSCKLPRIQKVKIAPLDDEDISNFIKACKGHRFEIIYLVTLFMGLREGEVLGLTWNCVDFKNNILTIDKQLQRERRGEGEYQLVSTKNDQERYLTMPEYVSNLLRRRKIEQEIDRKAAGRAWAKSNLVFTNELGHHLSAQTIYLDFKKIVDEIGRPTARFHDLRHTYAVVALQSGDDIKTLQENLGHYAASFTLDVYGHVIEKMRKKSAANIQRYIESIFSTQ